MKKSRDQTLYTSMGAQRKEGNETTGFACIKLRLACVAWRFWLGELSDKGRRGQRNREEIRAGATFLFLAASPLVLARFALEFFVDTPPLRPARQNRHATQAKLRLSTIYQNFRKIRLESKWYTTFWAFYRKISGNKKTSEKVVLFFRTEYSYIPLNQI